MTNILKEIKISVKLILNRNNMEDILSFFYVVIGIITGSMYVYNAEKKIVKNNEYYEQNMLILVGIFIMMIWPIYMIYFLYKKI